MGHFDPEVNETRTYVVKSDVPLREGIQGKFKVRTLLWVLNILEFVLTWL